MEYLTTAEFAELAQTTKRTIQLYDKIGVLNPKIRKENNYRYYTLDQLADFQIIFLLTQLGIELTTIKKLLSSNKKLTEVFKTNQTQVQKEIAKLTYSLNSTNEYIKNLTETKSLIKPELTTLDTLKIYYINSKASYSSIRIEIRKLLSSFDKIFINPTVLTLHPYPQKDKTRKEHTFLTGVIIEDEKSTSDMPKPTNKDVLYLKIAKTKCLKYTHTGPQRILEYLWNQMYEFEKRNNFERNEQFSYDIEIYTGSIFNGYNESFEHKSDLLIPLK